MNPASPAEEMAAIGSIADTLTILGRKFVMHTLDADAETTVSSVCGRFDAATQEHVGMVEKLARAITSINGVPFTVTEEERSEKPPLNEVGKARKLLYKWQPDVVKTVYAGLELLEKRRAEAVAELSKNDLTPTTSTGSGK